MVQLLVFISVIVAVFHSTTARLLIQKEYDLSEPSNEIPENDDTSTTLRVPELYWKPYNRTSIPEDAILAGVRIRNGEKVNVYIGQVDIDSIPGAKVQSVAVYSDSDYVVNTYTRSIQANKNIRILCSNATNLDNIITWIPSEKADRFNPEEDFVITGHELSKVTWSNTNLFTGRGTYQDDFVVGKVVMGTQSFRFYFVDSMYERLKKDNYEILAYTSALSKLKESD